MPWWLAETRGRSDAAGFGSYDGGGDDTLLGPC